MELQPDTLLVSVQRVHRQARVTVNKSSQAFLMWSSGTQSDNNTIIHADNERVVTSLPALGRRSNRPKGEHEVLTVFSVQQAHHPTVSAFEYVPRGEKDPTLLPAGYSLLEHFAAFILTAPDAQDLSPAIQCLRNNCVKPPPGTRLEVTIGKSSPS